MAFNSIFNFGAKRLTDNDYINPYQFNSGICSSDYCLEFPHEIQSPREKILYAIWHAGELPYYKLGLLTNLPQNIVEMELSALVKENKILTIDNRTPCIDQQFTSHHPNSQFTLDQSLKINKKEI